VSVAAGFPDSVLGEEQGVTSASLQSTLPSTPYGRAGGKARKSAPPKARKKKSAAEQRSHCVSVRLSTAELFRVELDSKLNRKRKASVLRDAYLKGSPPIVPPANVDLWRELSRALSNLNQVAAHLNAGKLPEDYRPLLADLAQKVHDLRADLVGQKRRK
jgi:hypothetical protein